MRVQSLLRTSDPVLAVWWIRLRWSTRQRSEVRREKQAEIRGYAGENRQRSEDILGKIGRVQRGQSGICCKRLWGSDNPYGCFLFGCKYSAV